MKLVFIHGRDQEGKDPVLLQSQWETAFDEGLSNAGLTRPDGLSIGFPFYGDELDSLIKQLNAPLIADVNERGAKPDTEEAEFRGEFLGELAEVAGLTEDDFKQFYTGPIQEKGVLNWGWVRSILKALDKSKGIGDLILDAITRDVYVYLTNDAVQRRIDSIVAPHLIEEPCVVVGHSLGSIVGYNVLRSATHNIVRYVTVGSPLGLKSIKRRLKPPLEMPATTQFWYNARDNDDFVALYPLDTEHFPITPAIQNKGDVDNDTDNQHGISGYLKDPDIARAIHAGFDHN